MKDKDLRRAAVDGWLAPFLIEALGFHGLEPLTAPLTLDDRSFPITHRAYSGAVPLVLVSPEFDLDKLDAAFGQEGRRRTPLGLLQDYLNAAEGAVWGVVSNGLVLRIVRDNPNFTRPAWIELDLERVFADQIYADFAAFWLLAHGTRFAPREGGLATSCILERWRQLAQQTGERARDHLRDGVAHALVALGKGFVAHLDNVTLREQLTKGTLTADGLHQQLLRLVYRCLFLFVVEDRDQLHVKTGPGKVSEEARRLWAEGYAIIKLRERARRPRLYDRYGDLWEGLKIAFRALESGAPEIGAPALGGLFARSMCPDLFTASLANEDLLTAIKALAFFKPDKSKSLARVNYRDLNTEELGSVYESLLELHPKLGREPWGYGYIGLNGDSAKGSERKLSGSYYTPSALVDELIKSALEPVILKTVTDNPYERRAALLRLKIVDPACGSGHFLLAAARRLARDIAVIDAHPDAPTEAQRQHAMREVVQHCIYGVDRNPLALELCKTALWIETVEPGRPLSFLDHHLRCGDSLIGVFDPKVLEAGIPDEAYKPKTGDDKKQAKTLKAQNKAERDRPLLKLALGEKLEVIAKAFADLEAMGEDNPQAVEAKAIAFARLTTGTDLHRLEVAADLWIAAFFARLVPSEAGQPGRVPTTMDVWKALDQSNGDQGPRAAAASVLAHEHRFFHWPLAFPEVFKQGGFDVMLGNPPWEVSQLGEEEFFASREPEIATLVGAKRKRAIAALRDLQPRLWDEYQEQVRNIDGTNTFIRASGRFALTAYGKLNLYSLFAELGLRLQSPKGRSGIIVQSGIATDDSNKVFFSTIVNQRRLVSLYDFENREGVFPAVDSRMKFCLLTLGSHIDAARFAFFLTAPDQLADERRRFTLKAADFALINPNTRTCPIFRTTYDAQLTQKIYRRVPVLVDEARTEGGNPWGIKVHTRIWNMTEEAEWFRSYADLAQPGAHLDGNTWNTPGGTRFQMLYEAKMIHHYDHRWATYDPNGKSAYVPDGKKADPEYRVLPRYWVDAAEVEKRLDQMDWSRGWLMGWRDITNNTNERTVIASVIPRAAVGHKFLHMFPFIEPRKVPALLCNLTSIVLDFVSRQKLGTTSLQFYIVKQLAVLAPSAFSDRDLAFVCPRCLELVYTAWDMQPFARDLGYEGKPFRWDPERRALLRAELDAYYAYLYGLTRDELRYILDPQDVMGEDWPSETFRVLKEKEIKEHGEYRTRRLVLEAFDRFHDDGTFDPARFSDPHYFDAVKAALATAKTQLADSEEYGSNLEVLYRSWVRRVAELRRPVLFVEGANDVPVIEAAWEVFCPGEPRPFSVLAAGGTLEMKALATRGKAMKQLLGDKLVFALSDNDGAGRELWDDGHLRKGGKWRQQTNGVHWCLLAPSPEFKAAMQKAGVPEASWPCLMENAFPAAIRRQAMTEGAYEMKPEFFADLLDSPPFMKTFLKLQSEVPSDDDLWLYLKAPTVEAKDAFTRWIIAPERRTPEVYAALRDIIEGLRTLLHKHASANGGDVRQQRLI